MRTLFDGTLPNGGNIGAQSNCIVFGFLAKSDNVIYKIVNGASSAVGLYNIWDYYRDLRFKFDLTADSLGGSDEGRDFYNRIAGRSITLNYSYDSVSPLYNEEIPSFPSSPIAGTESVTFPIEFAKISTLITENGTTGLSQYESQMEVIKPREKVFWENVRSLNMTVNDGTVVDSDAAAIIGRMSPVPSQPVQDAISYLVELLKEEGVWQKLDSFQMYAAEESSHAMLDWKRSSVSATNTGATFTPYEGVQGVDGSTTVYVNTLFTPSTDAVNATLGAHCAFAYINAAMIAPVSGSRAVFGAIHSSGTAQISFYNTNSISFAYSGGGSPGSLAARNPVMTTEAGLAIAQRTASATSDIFFNDTAGNDVYPNPGVESFFPNRSMYVCARHASSGTPGADSGSSAIVSCFGFGAPLDSTEREVLRSAIALYLTDIA